MPARKRIPYTAKDDAAKADQYIGLGDWYKEKGYPMIAEECFLKAIDYLVRTEQEIAGTPATHKVQL